MTARCVKGRAPLRAGKISKERAKMRGFFALQDKFTKKP
jgi:hypothetical protein